MKSFKEKRLTVDPDLYQEVSDQLYRHQGRCTSTDVNKDLELKLCKLIFPNSKVLEPPKQQDILYDIDTIVDNIKVQVKCRRNDHLYLEDYKTRKCSDGSTWTGGWLDRSLADIFLFVYPMQNNTLGVRIYKGSDLKNILRIFRAHQRNETLSQEDVTYINKWGGLHAYVYHPEKIQENGDGSGAYFEVVF